MTIMSQKLNKCCQNQNDTRGMGQSVYIINLPDFILCFLMKRNIARMNHGNINSKIHKTARGNKKY